MQHMDGNKIGGPVEPGTPNPHPPQQPHTDTEQDDLEEAAAESNIDITQFMPQLKPKRTWLRVLGWVILILIILGLVGGGAYYYMHHKKAAAPATSSQQSGTSNNTQQAAPKVPTKQYTSSNFNLSFNYPQDWVVTDTGGGKLTVTSSTMQLTDASGQSQKGIVVMTIQNENAADFSMFKTGSAVAVLNSQKIAYSNPTPTQRANTYISFLQYAATTTHGGLDSINVTGDLGYQKDQTIPETDIQKVSPVITVTFLQCASDACAGTPKAMTISSTMWNSQSFSAPITTMIESLSLQ